jgi:hypothetical protein
MKELIIGEKAGRQNIKYKKEFINLTVIYLTTSNIFIV